MRKGMGLGLVLLVAAGLAVAADRDKDKKDKDRDKDKKGTPATVVKTNGKATPRTVTLRMPSKMGPKTHTFTTNRDTKYVGPNGGKRRFSDLKPGTKGHAW